MITFSRNFFVFVVRKTVTIMLIQYLNRYLGYSGGLGRFFESFNEKFN